MSTAVLSPGRTAAFAACRPPGAAGPPTGLVCLVVGGKPEIADQLVRPLRANPTVDRVITAQDGADALRLLQATEVDIAFIELRMPGMDGADLAGVLGQFRAAPAVVFTGKGQQGAREALDLGAVDYLARPVLPARLDRSLRRALALRRRPKGQPAAWGPVPAGTRGTPPVDEEVIAVSLAGTTLLVRRSSVRWAQAHRDYVRLHTRNASYLVRARMTTLARDWAGTGLVRIHRSYMVRLNAIESVQRARSGHLYVIVDGQQLPVSRTLVPDLWRMLSGNAAGPAFGLG